MWKRGMRERDILAKNGYNDRTFWNYGHVSLGMLKLLMSMNQTISKTTQNADHSLNFAIQKEKKNVQGCRRLQHVHR